jgi:copper chaperone CopZ
MTEESCGAAPRSPVVHIPVMRHELLIDGMPAVHAKYAVFTALGAVEGVTGAEVELGRAVVEHDGRVAADALRLAVEAAGFTVREIRVLPRSLPTL